MKDASQSNADHVAAQERVLRAIMVIAADRGLEQATMREVAAEAGVSLGTVQYYGRSKDEMLVLAFRHVMDRIAARAAAVPPSGSVAAVLLATLLEFLPLDDDRERECRVYLAFAARAAVSEDLRAVQHELLSDVRNRCAQAFRLAQERGEAAAPFDPDEAAASTCALVDGLLVHLLTDPAGLPKDSARRALESHVRRFLELDSS